MLEVAEQSHPFPNSKMEKPSEGLPRIISRPKKYVLRMKLINKVPEEERKKSGQHFKPVWIGDEEKDSSESDLSESDSSESHLSDKPESGSEWSLEDVQSENTENWIGGEEEESELSDKPESGSDWSLEDVQLPEKPKAIDSKPVSVADEPQVDINEPLQKSPNKRYMRRPKNKNRRKKRCSNNYNFPKRSFNTSTKSYDYGTVASSSSEEKRIPNNLNSNDSSSNFEERSFQTISNSSNDIEPWEYPPVLLNTYPNSTYLFYPYVSAVGHLPARNSDGILGDSQYSHCAANFQPNNAGNISPVY